MVQRRSGNILRIRMRLKYFRWNGCHSSVITLHLFLLTTSSKMWHLIAGVLFSMTIFWKLSLFLELKFNLEKASLWNWELEIKFAMKSWELNTNFHAIMHMKKIFPVNKNLKLNFPQNHWYGIGNAMNLRICKKNL